MRAELVLNTLTAVWEHSKRSVCIEGPPGGGKTTIVNQFAERVGARLVHLHMPTKLVEDFGMPMPSSDGNKMRFMMPDWFPEDNEPVVMLFDDRNQCSADLQKLLANMMQERELHGHRIPDNVMFVSTGNRVSDRSGASRVLAHLRNRETVIEFETNLDDWCKFAIDQGAKPEVVSFIRFRPNLLHDFDPQRDANPTPRSWIEGVSDVVGVVPAEAEYECFKGAVGEGAAAEFVGFLKIHRKLPNPDRILLDPDDAEVPTDPATLYALSGSIATRASDSNFSRVIAYANRMPPEFSVLTVSYATRRDPKLADTQAFTNWAVEHQDVLF